MNQKHEHDFYETKSGVKIDPQRMDINETLFAPFEVTSFQSLQHVLTKGKVKEATNILGIECSGGKMLTFLTQQMAYHHVAQGEMDGEPWMVSF